MASLNLGGSVSGAASGAATGGSIGGLPGAVVGGIFGAATGLFGKKKKKRKISTFDKKQQQINDLQGQGLLGQGPLADLYNYNPQEANAVFDKTIANPAYRGFQENIVPTITGQFRSEGLQNSSYAGDALSKAGRDVQEMLDARRAEYLYGEQNNARTARRQGIENYQNRSTQAWDANNPSMDITDIINSIPKEAIAGVRDYFNKNPR